MAEKFQQDDQLRCNVISSPGSRPQIHRQLSRNPLIQAQSRYSESEFIADGGDITIHRHGEDHIDLQLTGRFMSLEDRKIFSELRRRDVPAYIYSAAPGALLHTCPLIRGVKGDPSDGTYTGAVASGTTVYIPDSDHSQQVYMVETDFATTPPIARGIERDQMLENELSDELPLGAGVAILSKAKNSVKNSGLDDDGTDVYNWILSGAGGADGVTRLEKTGWMGVRSLQIWGSNVWSQGAIDVSSAAGDWIAISFGWKSDNELTCNLYWDGSFTPNATYTRSGGSGYYRTSIQVPPGVSALMIEFENGTGSTYSEVCAVQVMLGDTTYGGKRFYYGYLEGYGNNVQGQITASRLQYSGAYQAAMWPMAAGSDSVLVVSGYVQPLIKFYKAIEPQRILGFYNTLTGKELECQLKYDGSDYKMYLRANATALSNVVLSGAAYGDTFFVALAVGFEAGTAYKRVYVRKVGGDTTYMAEHSGLTNFYTIYNLLNIGTDFAGNLGANCLFQDVNVWVGCYTPCSAVSTHVEYKANPRYLKENMLTCGRQYRFHPEFTPETFEYERYSMMVQARNVRTL